MSRVDFGLYLYDPFIYRNQDIQGNEFGFFAVSLNKGKKAKKKKKENRKEIRRITHIGVYIRKMIEKFTCGDNQKIQKVKMM